MASELKNITITVTPALKNKLDELKNEHYSKETDENMIRDLIALGLNAVEKEKKDSD